jgi:HAD superfamily hydrolase (TIGR01549 family)
MLKLVVLDWDDCITRGSSEGYYACYGAAIVKAGIERSPEEVQGGVRELWGRPHREVLAYIIGSDNPLLDAVTKYYEEFIFTDTFSSNLSLIPGAKEKLEELRTTYKLAVATGMNGTLFREHILPMFEMQDFFSCIMSSSELSDPSRGKPFPDMLLKILEALDIRPNEAVMVGDAKGDVLMAQAAGVEPIVVLTGQLTRKEAEQLGVTHIISDVTKLNL